MNINTHTNMNTSIRIYINKLWRAEVSPLPGRLVPRRLDGVGCSVGTGGLQNNELGTGLGIGFRDRNPRWCTFLAISETLFGRPCKDHDDHNCGSIGTPYVVVSLKRDPNIGPKIDCS